ncbi:MAG: hypothetical protein ACRC2T_14120 [Thermoguttaceae bacterium]
MKYSVAQKELRITSITQPFLAKDRFLHGLGMVYACVFVIFSCFVSYATAQEELGKVDNQANNESNTLIPRWSVPRPNLQNLPSVHKFLPPRDAVTPIETTQLDLPGFQGKSETEQADTAALDAMVADFSGKSQLIFPQRNIAEQVVIMAKSGWSKNTGNAEVMFLNGECSIGQGNDVVRGENAVVWIDNNATPKYACVYVESLSTAKPLVIEFGNSNDIRTNSKIQDQKWYGTFNSTVPIKVLLESSAVPQRDLPEIYNRAMNMRSPNMAKYQPRQYTATTNFGNEKANFRSIQFYQRSDNPTEFSLKTDPITNRSIGLITNGFNMVIEGIQIDNEGAKLLTGDAVDISADRAVIWAGDTNELFTRKTELQGNDIDLEIYLEGNIIFREGERTIYASKMYYDVKNQIGYILDAEMLTPAPGYNGLIRLKADILQQSGMDKITAKNAYITTSLLGEPSYRLQSNQLTFEEIRRPMFDTFSGAAIIDPETGKQQEKKRQLLVAESNVVSLGSVPVFYWPWMAADMQYKDSFLYLRDVNFGHDQMFGTQVRTTWNPYQLFNIKNPPEGVTWDISLDYLSSRGLGHGTNVTYSRNDFFGSAGPTAGMADYWGIYDTGKDNLGLDRRDLTPDQSYRYRAFWRHRQDLRNGWVVTAELGKASDRNFMPQYFENEWDTFKNQSTDLDLKKTTNNRSLGIFASVKLDEFETGTSWLPRLDHFWIGQSLLEDRLTWYEHTKVGLADFKTGTVPSNINTNIPYNQNYYRYLDWELAPGSPNDPSAPGFKRLSAFREVASTKHELDLPFNVGPVKFVPYVLGELAHWGEDVYGSSVQRFYYETGVRANLPIWKLMPNYNSRTWYLNGLAHKIDFNADFSYGKSNLDWDSLILYDQLDDYSVENFRRRYTFTTFGGNIPLQFDERYYAIRSGIASNVTSPVTELASDLTLLRLGMKNRWQTKRGPTGNRRIIDWITLDTHVNIYPDSAQNFGQNVGLIDYNLLWHVGDRFAVLSSGLYDVFDSGQQITRIGCMSNRPERGSYFLGIDRLDGPFTATYLNFNVAYTMNMKYSAEFGTSYDLERGQSVGSSLSIIRTGESFSVKLGTSVDTSRDVWGINFSIQPVFLSHMKKR